MIRIFTDGACVTERKDGGWAALLLENGQRKVLSGREGKTTSNRMELTAAIKALESTPEGATIILASDSQYLIHTMTKGWRRQANLDLWRVLDELAATRQVEWGWVKGHEGHPENEFVNALSEWEAGLRPAPPEVERYLGPQERVEAAPTLTHVDEQGRARMVDVGSKPETERVAVAKGSVVMQPETLARIREGTLEKGDVLTTARLAGIMAAKQTPHLIPLCHPLPLTHISVDLHLAEAAHAVEITATVKTTARTGVEMEALTAASIAALTIYDMCKAVDRAMRIEGLRLTYKAGGKSGELVLE